MFDIDLHVSQNNNVVVSKGGIYGVLKKTTRKIMTV